MATLSVISEAVDASSCLEVDLVGHMQRCWSLLLRHRHWSSFDVYIDDRITFRTTMKSIMSRRRHGPGKHID